MASNKEEPLIKHEYELKKRLFLVRVEAPKCLQVRLRYRARKDKKREKEDSP